MGRQKIHTESLVELYSMAKMYADDHPIISTQENAILEAEQIIENTTGWEVTRPYDSDE